VEKGKRSRTKADIVTLAEKLNKHPATIYRWLANYEATGLVSSLLRRPRADKGTHRIDPRVEEIISDCINKYYLSDQQWPLAKAAYEIRKQCKEAMLIPPDTNTVRSRVLAIDESIRVAKREGRKKADEKFAPLRGSFPNADYPLAVVQIDHTPMDVIVVDDLHRKPINRPYLTLAIDVYSKMIVGFYISLEAVGALSTGLCISSAILTKDKFLEGLGIQDLDWPCWGLMRTIHTDNAKEFRGTMLGRAAQQYGIICERRPKGKPQYGGHVERAFRTHMSEVHSELPGTTFSNPKFRREYDSDGRAVMTLEALELWFTLFVIGVYHHKPHTGNDMIPPIVKWERGLLGDANVLGRGLPAKCTDEARLRIDFLPYIGRTVQEYGIALAGITYYSDALRRFIHARDPKSTKLKRVFICRYDPRDLRKIWFYDEDSKIYIDVPYKDITRPPISIWELREAKRILRQESKSVSNEELVFKTIDRMRAVVEQESNKTKKARRLNQRRKQWEKAQREPKAVKKSAVIDTTPELYEEYQDAVQPFEDIQES
jgi:putative transposase